MLSRLLGNRRTTDAKQCNGIIISGDNNRDITIHYGPTEGRLSIPFKPNSLTDSIDSLLIWQSRLTPLIGRDKTLAELEQWAKNGPRINLKLIHGEGGVGKTRLAFELADRLKGQNWEAGQLATLCGGSGFRLGESGTLLIIDYPEQQPKRVQQLLQGIKEAEEPAAPLRILLLSRNPQLLHQMVGESLGYLTAPALPLLSLDEEGAAWQLFEAAWPRLCQQRQQANRPLPIDQTAFSRWLTQHERHNQPLFILAYLINLFEEPQATTLSAAQIIERLVARERDRLAREGEAAGLQPVALPLLKGLAAITGGITVRQLEGLAGYDSLAARLPDYEALRHRTIWRTGDGDGGVEELQPDLLAAALLSQLLKREDDLSGEWLYAALDVSGDMKKATSRLGRLMHDAIQVLGLPWPQQALNEAVANDLSRCRRLDEGLSRGHLEPPLLPLALHVTQRLVEATEEPSELARLLNNLSVRLAESGDRDGGLKAIQRAVEIRKKLAEENFAAYAPDLAQSLNNLSNHLAKSGDRDGGLKAIQRAVEIYERLAEENLAAYAPDLAMGLHNLSIRLAESGDRDGGLKAIQRAVEIYEKLAAENLAAYAPDLALSLNNLSNHLAESGDRDGGLKAIQRAVEIYEKLAEENSAAYAPDLALSLNNLSNRLAATGDRDGGLKAIQRAVEIREKLVEENSAAYAPDLAGSLAILANRLKERGETSEAITTVERAIALITPFATDGTTYSDWLAEMKNNLARYQAACE